MNSIQFVLSCFSTPLRIRSALCGCKEEELSNVGPDLSPAHSCLSGTLLALFTDHLLVLKNSKNKLIETKYSVQKNKFLVSFITPAPVSNISAVIALIKKSINMKTINKSIAMVNQLDPKYYTEKGKVKIFATMADLITVNCKVQIFGKKLYTPDQQKTFINKLTTKLTFKSFKYNREDAILPPIQSGPELLKMYVNFIGFNDLDKGIQAIVVVSLQSINADFVQKDSQLYVNREDVTNENLKTLQLFLQARLRFLTKVLDKQKLNKKLLSLVSFVYQQGCFFGDVTSDIMKLANMKPKDAARQGELFAEIGKDALKRYTGMRNAI